MSNHLLSADEVKNKLGISDFRSISKDQIIEFVSSIPDMEKETAIKCIEQFPEFKSCAGIIIDRYCSLCEAAIKEDGKDALASNKEILDDLRFMLKKDNISEDMQKYIIEKMVEVGNSIANIENDKRSFKEMVLKYAGTLSAIALTIAGTILGVKIVKK